MDAVGSCSTVDRGGVRNRRAELGGGSGDNNSNNNNNHSRSNNTNNNNEGVGRVSDGDPQWTQQLQDPTTAGASTSTDPTGLGTTITSSMTSQSATQPTTASPAAASIASALAGVVTGQQYCCHTSQVLPDSSDTCLADVPAVPVGTGRECLSRDSGLPLTRSASLSGAGVAMAGASPWSPGTNPPQASLFSAESFQEAHRQLGLATPSPPGTPPVTPCSAGGSGAGVVVRRSSSEDALSSSSMSSQENFLDSSAATRGGPTSPSNPPYWAAGSQTHPTTSTSSVSASHSRTQGDCASLFYYHALRFLLVGDSDVGKNEILEKFEAHRLPLVNQKEVEFKTTMILLDGKRIKLQLWDTSGQGRFSTIIQSYSRGADGILLVFDITNRWSFESLDKWLKEVDEYASGVPRVLVGNRLHFEFRREVNKLTALQYAAKHGMSYLEVSPLADHNITETLVDLSRQVLNRIRLHSWHENRVLSLQELCCRTIVQRTTSYSIERLPLPASVKSNLKSYSLNPYSAASLIACCSQKSHGSKSGCLGHHSHQRHHSKGHSSNSGGLGGGGSSSNNSGGGGISGTGGAGLGGGSGLGGANGSGSGGRRSSGSSKASRSSSPHNLLEAMPISNLRHHHHHFHHHHHSDNSRKCTIS